MTHSVEIPTISVIIPCFNAEKTIERCVESIMSQSLLPNEVLIYDDASTDGTPDILEKLAKSYDEIQIFSSQINQGAGVARTVLLENASCTYLAFLDADDVWKKQKLEKQIQVLEDENADICVCGYEIFNDQGEQLGKRQPPKVINYRKIHLANWIPTSMAVVRADLIGTRQMPNIRRRQDYAYWLNIFKTNADVKCVTLDSSLGTYYRNESSLSSNWRKNFWANYAMFRQTLGYSIFFSSICVGANIITRLFRV